MGFHRKGVSDFLGGAFREGTVSSAGSSRQHLWVTHAPRALFLRTQSQSCTWSSLSLQGHTGVAGICPAHSRSPGGAPGHPCERGWVRVRLWSLADWVFSPGWPGHSQAV